MLYKFNINNRAFKAIKEKRKRIEIRVTTLDEDSFDYSCIKENDLIEFTSYDGCILTVKVTDVNWYKTIEELLTLEGTKYTLSSTNDFNEGVKSINSFNGYEEGIKVNGIYAIHIIPILNK